jgi:hypothetical protein
LKEGSNKKFEFESDYRKVLNKKDPFDKQILNLVKHGELKIGVVGIKESSGYNSDKCNRNPILRQGKHSA